VGIAAFGSVVVLTMLASLSFDPKLTWDSKEAQAIEEQGIPQGIQGTQALQGHDNRDEKTSMSEEDESQPRTNRCHPHRPRSPRCQAARGAAARVVPSLIWLIPIVAALVGITLVARIIMERGPRSC